MAGGMVTWLRKLRDAINGNGFSRSPKPFTHPARFEPFTRPTQGGGSDGR